MHINGWYPMATPTELHDQPLLVRVSGRDFVVFRDSKGQAHCLVNVCPHRGHSLAGGKIKGDCIQCPFHGWQFDGDGNCTRIPSLANQADIPANTRIAAFPVEERDGAILAFLGDLPEAEHPPVAPSMASPLSFLPMDSQIYNVNVVARTILPPPAEVKANYPLSPALEGFILRNRRTLQQIIDARDPRLFVVVGPCSIHDVTAALDYAKRLKALADAVSDTLVLVMRVYFEKPRTTVGWKGLINDPDMDDSFHIEKGIGVARSLLLELARLGLPTATEALDPIMPQYLGDLITWNAIGARTTESQTHREMASGLSTPVGFKNGTDGSLTVAINALKSARQPHHFLGINEDGRTAVLQTRGNAYGHVVLRGGAGRPNYDSVCVAQCEQELRKAGLPERIVIDCSHGNSNKDPSLQPLVARDCIEQVVNGNRSIIGLMLESNLEVGNQEIPADRSKLRYGVSVTDGCIDWPTTERSLRELAVLLKPVVQARKSA